MAAPGQYSEKRDPFWVQVDPILIVVAALIAALGAALVYSATRGTVTDLIPANTAFVERQVVFIAGGAVLATVAALVNPDRIRTLIPLGYGGLIFLLMAVLVLGTKVNGARAWFQVGGFQFQPSEPGKLVLIVVLAAMFSTGSGLPLRRLLIGLFLAGLPVGLILLQPDLGTMLVYAVITLAVLVIGGVPGRHLALLVLLSLTLIVGVLQSDRLADYQVQRLTVFVFDDPDNPYAFNVEQAQIAIGNGGLTGMGLYQGTQTRSNLVPEQQTDFIFTVAGEELGFRGAGTLLLLYALLLYRIWTTAQEANDQFDQLLCIGVLAMFMFQIFQSVGMTMGMMPVTGIPLPLVSYGGSSMVTSMVGLGLVHGVHRRRFG